MSRLRKADKSGIDKIVAEIANNPTITSEELIRKAKELGYIPEDLIDKAYGSVLYEKSGANLSSKLEDILNNVYEKDPTPGIRYVFEPLEARSRLAKDYASYVKENPGILGFQTRFDLGKSRKVPEHTVVLNAYDDMSKLQQIAAAGHEIDHQVDDLIRPGFKSSTPRQYEKGHHYGDIYETSELIREARDLPRNQKELDEIVKQSKKIGLKPTYFRRLMSLVSHAGPIGAGIAAASALKSGDVPAATLHAASIVDPTGITDVASEVKDRLKMSPEEQKEASKEDYYSAMPFDIANEQRLLSDLEKYPEPKYKNIREKLR